MIKTEGYSKLWFLSFRQISVFLTKTIKFNTLFIQFGNHQIIIYYIARCNLHHNQIRIYTIKIKKKMSINYIHQRETGIKQSWENYQNNKQMHGERQWTAMQQPWRYQQQSHQRRLQREQNRMPQNKLGSVNKLQYKNDRQKIRQERQKNVDAIRQLKKNQRMERQQQKNRIFQQIKHKSQIKKQLNQQKKNSINSEQARYHSHLERQKICNQNLIQWRQQQQKRKLQKKKQIRIQRQQSYIRQEADSSQTTRKYRAQLAEQSIRNLLTSEQKVYLKDYQGQQYHIKMQKLIKMYKRRFEEEERVKRLLQYQNQLEREQKLQQRRHVQEYQRRQDEQLQIIRYQQYIAQIGLQNRNNGKQQEVSEDIEKRNWTRQCSICLQNILRDQKVIYLNCAHYFHSQCIIPWAEKSQLCPNCRTKIERE